MTHSEPQLPEPSPPSDPPIDPGMTAKERATLYVEMWKQTVTVQQHFNDIEWRIRGLALTAATFSVGAAGLSVNNDHPLTGAVIVGVGLVLWYAFYFVDLYWYHPLLKASVDQAHVVEDKIEAAGLPDAALSRAISAGSPIDRPSVIRFFTRKANRDTKLHSNHKLIWFYRVGFFGLSVAFVIFTVLGVVGLFKDSPEAPPTIVKIDAPAPSAPTVTATGTATPKPSPTTEPMAPNPSARRAP